MLEHVAIIDDCDTLGQKLDAENGIHKVRQYLYITLDVISPVLIEFFRRSFQCTKIS